MKSHKIQSNNPNAGATDNNYVKGRDFDKIIEDLELIYPVTHVPFAGEVYLGRYNTMYDPYTVVTNFSVTASTDLVIGAYAELTLVADGSHTPTFGTAFTATPASDTWDVTLGKVHKCGVYYDGTYIFYTLTIIN